MLIKPVLGVVFLY